MKYQYDGIVTLGYRFDNNWELPGFLQDALQLTADLFKNNLAPVIIVSGKWNLVFDSGNIVPPYTEAQKMKKALVAMGVNSELILLEEDSKDTIGNAYFVKTNIVVPRGMRRLLVVCADFHVIRVRFIFHKIFGNEYTIDIKPVPTAYNADFYKQQEAVLRKQIKFLSAMADGEDVYLRDKLYSDPYFK